MAAGATAATTQAPPHVKPITGAVAVGATVIGVGADVVEQLARPDIQQVIDDSISRIIQDRIEKRLPVAAPITNELFNAWKNSGTSKDLQTWSNEAWSSYLKRNGVVN